MRGNRGVDGDRGLEALLRDEWKMMVDVGM